MMLATILAAALASAPAAAPPRLLPCVYAARGGNDTVEHPDCAWKDADGTPHVTPAHLRRLHYDRDGLAVVHIDGFYYVRSDGRLAPTLTMDNWADDFQDGLARSPANGKIGYIDRDLRWVIPARYDGAYPFSDGGAWVCQGCKTVTEGEHRRYDSRLWICIDRSGRERFNLPVRDGGGYGSAVCRSTAAPVKTLTAKVRSENEFAAFEGDLALSYYWYDLQPVSAAEKPIVAIGDHAACRAAASNGRPVRVSLQRQRVFVGRSDLIVVGCEPAE